MDDSAETGAPEERDDATFDMGFEPQAKPGGAEAYEVLARKYRPRSFADMIGQDAMVRTLTNAFQAGRIAHAFMLTGVRGVGKTTTARLLARALNYVSEAHDGPHIDLSQPGLHCEAIMTSRHPDVIEMDAASHTGVDEMRELLDGVRYAPVQARYKVYIIDEVHMLSGHSFNALLKTLEEPPPHVKFVFATTEIRKVPVTVLSRCQRFDLKRVDSASMVAHLAKVCEAESAQVSEDGLRLIARAAEGSVRDALSLLDQAIVQADDGAEVGPAEVRDMLGLADHARVLDLFEAAARGEAARAVTEMRDQYDSGADPMTVLRDLLEYAHELSRGAALGERADYDAAPDQAERLRALAAELGSGKLSRIWQMLLKGHEEARIAPDPLASAEMTLIRIAVASALPSPEDAAKTLAREGAPDAPPPAASGSPPTPPSAESRAPSGDAPVAQLRAEPEAEAGDDGEDDGKPMPASLEDAARMIGEARDLQLKYDIERGARPVSFKPGQIVFQPGEDCAYDLQQRMSRKLKELTGRVWAVIADPDAKGGETLADKRRREEAAARKAALDSDEAKAFLQAFPDAKLLEIRKRSNVVSARFGHTPDDEDPAS